MSFGFLGIQFGWGLQMANMSAIYEYLGARADQIPILWLAAPLTGLIVQPIIGHASDRTWNRLGRRRPYFLTGAMLSSAALILMPRVSALWMAAGLLWILDASINISMEPFRAFVADLLPEEQRTRGFAMQSLFIGLGAVVASVLPGILLTWLGGGAASGGRDPAAGAAVFLYRGGGVFRRGALDDRHHAGVSAGRSGGVPPDEGGEARPGGERARDSGIDRRHAADHEATRLGADRHVAGAVLHVAIFPGSGGAQRVRRFRPAERALHRGRGLGRLLLCVCTRRCVSCLSFALPPLANALGRKATHSLCLLCGAAGLMSVAVIHNKWLLFVSMVGVGIAWASTLAMPYAILAGSLPAEKTGIYMGIFNFFIVMPEIVASLGFGWVMAHLLDNNRLLAVVAGGVFFVVAAALMQRVRDVGVERAAGVREGAVVGPVE